MHEITLVLECMIIIQWKENMIYTPRIEKKFNNNLGNKKVLITWGKMNNNKIFKKVKILLLFLIYLNFMKRATNGLNKYRILLCYEKIK